MEVATDYIDMGYYVRHVLAHCGISKSSYYYQPTRGKSGRQAYAVILDHSGTQVSDEVILDIIKELFSHPFVDYGSYKTYRYLSDQKSYSISKHKVYRLMRDHQLTRTRYQHSSKKNKRNWVKDLIPQVDTPFSFFEFDIKYMWVEGQRRNIQVLTIIDVYTRFNMGQYIAYSIKEQNVIQLFEQVIDQFGLPNKFTVRCDNGSQFIANTVQAYLIKRGVYQEFTKPSTPQQNAHVESYHSIMERAICQRFSFEDGKELKKVMEEFRDFYNFERIHGGIGYTSPYKYILQKEAEFSSASFVKSFLLVKQMYNNFKKVS